MAIDATDIFMGHPDDHKLDEQQLRALHDGVRYMRTAEESKSLTANPMAKVIISASGMATGGRVLHHLEHHAPDPRNSILFAGFQAGGTRGAAMVAGARRDVGVNIGNFELSCSTVRNAAQLALVGDLQDEGRDRRDKDSKTCPLFLRREQLE